MELIFINNGKYICEVCMNSFNWNDDSWSFGNLENDKEETKVFCSSKCKEKFIKINNEIQSSNQSKSNN